MIQDWIYIWIDERGRIPSWAKWIWPKAHWCPEMDDLLCLSERDQTNCFCGYGRSLDATTPDADTDEFLWELSAPEIDAVNRLAWNVKPDGIEGSEIASLSEEDVEYARRLAKKIDKDIDDELQTGRTE
jgi:hypothetical protein